jgi:hypothetical protein
MWQLYHPGKGPVNLVVAATAVVLLGTPTAALVSAVTGCPFPIALGAVLGGVVYILHYLGKAKRPKGKGPAKPGRRAR